jgi:hypothetical protein
VTQSQSQRRAARRRRRTHFARADLAQAMSDAIRVELPKKRLIVEPNWHVRSLSNDASPVIRIVATE